MLPHDSLVPFVGIPLLAALVAVLFLAGVHRTGGVPSAVRAALVLALWVALTGLAAGSGVLGQFDRRPPPMVPFMAACIVLGVGLGLSVVGRRFADGLPLWLLVGVQGFRLPLELVMHRAAEIHLMPRALSYSGANFDIVTGGLALVVGAWLLWGGAPRAVVWAWNLLGFGTLAVIVVVAVLSSPMVRAFGDAPENVNTWVTHVPYVWLPAVLVVAALAGHVTVTRALLRRA